MKKQLSILLEDVRQMSRNDHLVYWIVPVIVLGIFFGFYFSEVPALVEFICPKENWEWGVLENIQLGLILAMVVLSFYAFAKKSNKIQKWGFFLIGLFGLFVFLEEIDYGVHFTQLVDGKGTNYLGEYTGIYNIHNMGNNAKIFKRSVYLLMALLFVIGPFLKPFLKNPYLSYLVPKPRIVIIAVLAIIVDLLPRFIIHFGIRKDGGLGVNIGEFSEIVVYFIFFIYLTQLIFINQLKPATALKK